MPTISTVRPTYYSNVIQSQDRPDLDSQTWLFRHLFMLTCFNWINYPDKYLEHKNSNKRRGCELPMFQLLPNLTTIEACTECRQKWIYFYCKIIYVLQAQMSQNVLNSLQWYWTISIYYKYEALFLKSTLVQSEYQLIQCLSVLMNQWPGLLCQQLHVLSNSEMHITRR